MSIEVTGEDIDAFRELINIGIGRSAGMLDKITGSHVTLSVPDVRVLPIDRFDESFSSDSGEDVASVSLDYSGSFSGRTAVVFPQDSAAKLAMAVTGEDEVSPELDGMKVEALKEVGNILVSGVMGSVSNALKSTLSYSIPVYNESEPEILIKDCLNFREESVIIGRVDVNIMDLQTTGNIVMILGVGSLEHLLSCLRHT